jgi:hypothetical protein
MPNVLAPKTARYVQACQYRAVPAGSRMRGATASIITASPSAARAITFGDRAL